MKMKKIISVLTALMTAMTLPLSAMAAAEEINPELSGYVTLMVDGGFIMNDAAFGQVLCNTDDTTVLEGHIIEDGISEGDYVIVQYDGRMTRSIPPQVHADRVCSYRLDGVVLEIMDENVLAIDVPQQGEVWVYTEEISSNIIPGMNVTVFYDGIMALSYPARVSARELVLPELTGTVSEIGMTESGNRFLLTTEDGQVEIAISNQTRFSQLQTLEASDESEETTVEEILLTAEIEAAEEEPTEEELPETEESSEAETEPADETAETTEDEPAEEAAPSDGDADEVNETAEETAPVEENEGTEEPAEEPIAETQPETAEPSEETASEKESESAPAFSVADYLKDGDRITVYYGGHAEGEGPLHALKIVILP